MNSGEREALQQIYQGLKNKIDELISGAITADQLKPSTAPFGIYEQRNGLFMVRIRITGGHITAANLREIAGIIERNNIGYAHLSSRQDIQLHDVAADKIYTTVLDSDRIGLPFKGGGGNTFRNILVSGDSGFAPGQVFDVSPYARQLNDILRRYEKAFGLPRKLKIGFYSSPGEEFSAAVQDLGFLAVTQNGRRGFKVYGGGGMGRESSLGVKLLDFLPDDQVSRCAVAMVDLFDAHGDRTNRNRARIRFIVKSIGEEAFVKLFLEYFAQAQAEKLAVAGDIDYSPSTEVRFRDNVPAGGFAAWRDHAVLPTGLGKDYSAVRIYVPYGNLKAEQLQRIAALADDFGGGFVRLLPSQDIMLAPVHNATLVALHRHLLVDFAGIDLTLKSFKGHILSCVGANVCKIGVLPAPDLADLVAEKMDELLPADTPEKLKKLHFLTSQVRISGCPNSCSGHPAAKIGIQGQKQRINDQVEEVGIIFTGASDCPDSLRLSTAIEGAAAIKVADLPAAVNALLTRLI